MHTHDWQPIQGQMARYRCATCGAPGHRARDGEVTSYRTPPKHHAEEQVMHSTAGKKPSLDDYDRRSR
jgi:hypothetical protein